MYASFKPARLCGGLTLLALCGCHTYSPYGPYGSGYGYPPRGTYSAPPAYYVPGGTVVPGTTAPNGGTISPGKTGTGGVGSLPSGSGASSIDGKSPTFEAKRGTSGLLPNEKPVPDPKSPESTGFPDDPAGTAPGGASSGTGAPMNKTAPSGSVDPAPAPKAGNSGSPSGFPSGTSPFNNSATGDPSSARIKLTGSDKGETSQEPARFQQPKAAAPISPTGTPAKGGSSTIIEPPGSAPMSSASGAPSPYDYDRKAYTWLRGKVDYDEGTKTWQIIYSLDGKDRYGGSLTLSDDPKLKKLRNDDVVLVEGRVDESRKTGRGKPVYKIDYLFGPLVPKTKVGLSPSSAVPRSVATNAR